MKKIFASLKFHNYRLWFFAAIVANVGTWMQRIAQDWLVYHELSGGSAFSVGIVTALQFIPVLLISPWAGVLADRLDRRRLLITTQACMGLLALSLGSMTITGVVEIWHVYVFALLLGTVTAFDNPGRQIFVSDLVPENRLANDVSLNSASFNAARLVGPGVAGILIALVGTGWVFLINAVSFLATILAMLVMRKLEFQKLTRVKRGRGQLRQGLGYISKRSDIMVILMVIGVASMLGLNFQITSAAMAVEEFGKDATEYGILGSIMAIGSLSGALMTARREHPRVRLVVIYAALFGFFLVIQAFMPTYFLYAAMCIPVGWSALSMMTSANGAVQISTAPEIRGRVMAIYMTVFLGATPIGSPIIGWVAEHLGARWAVGIGGMAVLGIALAAWIWTASHWKYRIRYSKTRRLGLSVVYQKSERKSTGCACQNQPKVIVA